MEAAVPFALLASVQVVAFAAALGLAATGLTLAYRRTSGLMIALGAGILAATHALTGAELGASSSVPLVVARVVGYLLLAGGISGLRTVAGPLVVVPLAAPAPLAFLAAAAALGAAAATSRLKRPGARLLVVGFLLAAVREALAAWADRPVVAIVALVARGLSSLAIIGFLVRLAETRLLAKVVGAILAGVLALAVGVALVVGSVATRSLAEDQAASIERVALGQVAAITDIADTSSSLAIAYALCAPVRPDCPEGLFRLSAYPKPFAVTVARGGRSSQVLGLTTFEALDLGQSAPVTSALRTGLPLATLEVLHGGTPKLVALGIAPPGGEFRRANVDRVYVFGAVVDDDRVARIKRQTDFDATILAGGTPVVSSLRGDALDRVRREYDNGAGARIDGGEAGVTIEPEGERPAIRFVPLRDARGSTVAVLALSADPATVLQTQRAVLRALFVGTLVVAVLVGLLALSLGRRLTRPVQELTLAAARVRGGDLDVRTGVRTKDELGVLARTFDAMTSSLAGSRDELVAAAARDATLRARLQAILNSMGDGLVTTGVDGTVTAANPAALALLGVSENDLAGRPLAEVLAGRDTTGGPLVGDLREGVRVGVLTASPGRAVSVALAVTPLSDGTGHVVVVRDTSREREVERMKTEFLSNVSHELRTPLTPIRGYAEILANKPGMPDDQVAQFARTMLDSTLRMTRVVDLLVDVAALEAGRVVPAAEPVVVGAFVDARLAEWRKRHPDREFRRRVAAGLPAALVDRHWVGKALDELLDNAVKFSTGPVTVSAGRAPDGRRVRFTVRDTGPGIADDRRSALFTAFEQVDGSATRTVGGLGLGLSFVRRVADDFGLEVSVDTAVGKGSSFSLDVPVVTGSEGQNGQRAGGRTSAGAAAGPKRRTE